MAIALEYTLKYTIELRGVVAMDKTYTIQQVAKISGLGVHTLRYYERIGLLHSISRDSNGYRKFTQEDIAWIEFLNRLRATGMPIKLMLEFAYLRSKGPATTTARRQLLEKHRSEVLQLIQELEQNLAVIENKINYYKKLEEN